MKQYRTIILLALLFIVQPVLAANDSLVPGDIKNYIGYGAIMAILLLFIIVMLILLRTFNVLTRVILKSQGYTEEQVIAEMKPVKAIKTEKADKPKGEIWNKLLSLRPLSEEKELLIAHEYDGIQELDNPTPDWFMYLFYFTIGFAVIYMLSYHVFGIGALQYQEYRQEVVQAATAQKAFLGKAANRVDENTVKLVTDPAVLTSGQAIFKKNCVACHGDHAQGIVGPNLTDDYWLHGNNIGDIFKTIKYGIQTKGMPTWEKQLSPKQIADVANFVESLHGSNPPNAKEPQGIKAAEAMDKPVKKA